MARIRYLKPEFFTDEDLGAMNPLDRIAFEGLWCQCDKAGRVADRPKRLKVLCLPYDEWDFDACLDRLHVARFIIRYEKNGVKYIQVRTWERHQRPHHTEPESIIPPPDGFVTVETPLSNGSKPLGKGKGKGKDPTTTTTTSTSKKEKGDARGKNTAAWEQASREVSPSAPPDQLRELLKLAYVAVDREAVPLLHEAQEITRHRARGRKLDYLKATFAKLLGIEREELFRILDALSVPDECLKWKTT